MRNVDTDECAGIVKDLYQHNAKLAEPNSSVTAYHRTTSRIDDLVVTFMEDGSIALKRDKESFITTAEEMIHVVHLASSLRDYNKEQAKNRASFVDGELEKSKARLASLKDQRTAIRDEHGV